MKVFISHAFGGGDEELAGALKGDLAAAGLDGYLAEESQRYDLLIGDKIRQEIDESDWLVAIITERGQASASLHEEIGYALKGGARVALMIEEGVEKKGVLVYGKEYETFSAPNFAEHSRKVARSIAESPRPPPRRHPLGEDARAFLEGRRILSTDSADFAENDYFPQLFSPVPDDGEKPVALFTACPHDLENDADVTAPEFAEWVGATAGVEVDGRRVRVLGLEPHVDIGRLLAIDLSPRAPPRRDVLVYREFQSSGFFEYGTSHLFFTRNDRGARELHLCYMVGEFWAFLAQARLFYRRIGLDSPFTTFLSVKNSDRLRLSNYGDDALRTSPDRGAYLPVTHRRNISLQYAFKSVSEATDEEIARAAKRAAKEVCNAYGETTPRCYGEDGSFSWRLWSTAARGSAMGGQR